MSDQGADEDLSQVRQILENMDEDDDDSIFQTQDELNSLIYQSDHLDEIGDCVAEADFEYPDVCVKLLKKYQEDDIIVNHWDVANLTLTNLRNLSGASESFAERLANEDTLNTLKDILTKEKYVEELKAWIADRDTWGNEGEQESSEEEDEEDDEEEEEVDDDEKIRRHVYELFEDVLIILQNIATDTDSQEIFKDTDIIEEAIDPLTELDESFAAIGLFILIGLKDDDDESEDSDTAKVLVELLKKALMSDDRKADGFSAITLVRGLHRLASKDTDDSKDRVAFSGAVPLLVMMLHSDSEEEQSAAAECIWMIAQDDDVCPELAKNKKLIKALETLKASDNKDVSENAAGALWVIQSEDVQESSSNAATAKSPNKQHVFISYTHVDKPTVKEISDKLKSHGYEVWIDVDKMHKFESIMDGMAFAVENAAVVLMCMSEKYKDSKNCKMEAEYSAKREKVIIPLVMQRGYKPEGWLGLQLGQKLYFDFSGKCPMEESMGNLLDAIGNRGKKAE